ncbi:hypothetical protein GCM10023238_03010 [Streptomyces heliomycini]
MGDLSRDATPFTGNKTSVRTDDVVMPDGSVSTATTRSIRGPWPCSPSTTRPGPGAAPVPPPRAPQAVGDPAGLLDVPAENPLHAAQRELYEEAHLRRRLAGA